MAVNFLHRLHGQSSQLHNFIFAFKISSDEESFIAMGTFCYITYYYEKLLHPLQNTLTVDFQSQINIRANIINLFCSEPMEHFTFLSA